MPIDNLRTGDFTIGVQVGGMKDHGHAGLAGHFLPAGGLVRVRNTLTHSQLKGEFIFLSARCLFLCVRAGGKYACVQVYNGNAVSLILTCTVTKLYNV